MLLNLNKANHRANRYLFSWFSSGVSFGLCPYLKSRNPERAQTALETAFVFTAIIFLTFAMMNLSVQIHTRFVATYAAFMAARSYQVYGDHTGRQGFKEQANGLQTALLDELNTLAVIRTAEDIFTCALPWVSPPEGDVAGSGPAFDPDGKAGCMEGQRRYEKTNINKQIAFFVYRDDQSNPFGSAAKLEALTPGFKEQNREPLRFGIMRLQYKNRMIINPYGVFDGEVEEEERGVLVKKTMNEAERNKRWHRVFVPALLNPGLESGLVDVSPQDQQNQDVDQEAGN